MIMFPERTRLAKPHRMDKKALVRNMELSPQQKRDLTDQILKIQITNQIDQNTTNIPSGRKVHQIMVMNIRLKGTEINRDLIQSIDEQIGMYLAFIVETEDGKQHLIIQYKEPVSTVRNNKRFLIKKRFETDQDEIIEFNGVTLDEVYENLVRTVAADRLIDTASNDVGSTIEIQEEIDRLTKKADQLKKKMYREKSMRKQLEAKNERQKILNQIQVLKGEKK